MSYQCISELPLELISITTPPMRKKHAFIQFPNLSFLGILKSFCHDLGLELCASVCLSVCLSVSQSDSQLTYLFLKPQRSVRFSQQFTGTHLYSWEERGTARIKLLTYKKITLEPVTLELGCCSSQTNARQGQQRSVLNAKWP